jgi:hypothetical protein
VGKLCFQFALARIALDENIKAHVHAGAFRATDPSRTFRPNPFISPIAPARLAVRCGGIALSHAEMRES